MSPRPWSDCIAFRISFTKTKCYVSYVFSHYVGLVFLWNEQYLIKIDGIPKKEWRSLWVNSGTIIQRNVLFDPWTLLDPNCRPRMHLTYLWEQLSISSWLKIRFFHVLVSSARISDIYQEFRFCLESFSRISSFCKSQPKMKTILILLGLAFVANAQGMYVSKKYTIINLS